MDSERQKLVERLEYVFSDISLLDEALSHASAQRNISNERLEFLGDRVLGLVIADYLMQSYPSENEGQWARRLAVLTSRKLCRKVADKYNMQAALVFDEHNREAHLSKNVRANLCEAIIAAIYLDGGLDTARQFIHAAWGSFFKEQIDVPVDYKTALQELCQKYGLGLPVYEKINQKGPSHAPEIAVKVSLLDGRSFESSSTSKKQAEHKAAELLFADLSEVNA